MYPVIPYVHTVNVTTTVITTTYYETEVEEEEETKTSPASSSSGHHDVTMVSSSGADSDDSAASDDESEHVDEMADEMSHVVNASFEEASRHAASNTTPASQSTIRSLLRVRIPSDMPSSLCPVCQDDLCDSVIVLPCKHVFHENCIVRWLSRNDKCPLCR